MILMSMEDVPSSPPAEAGSRPASPPPERRRGPGRPPSRPPAPTLQHSGIVAQPSDAHNRLEFVYGDPSVFKAFFTYLKNVHAREVHLRCSPSGLAFFARDHSRTSRIVGVAAGEHVNWHYCAGTYWLCLARESVEKMFAAIDKSFFKFTIRQSWDDTESLTFVFKDASIDKDCFYRIGLSAYTPDPDLYAAEAELAGLERSHPVEFTLSAKHFKKSVTDAAGHTDTITVEKIGDFPLQITYATAGLVYNEVYRDPARIALRAELPPGSAFRCALPVASVKSLAASMVSDDVRVICSADTDIVFRSALEVKALVVSTLTARAS